ncbi:Integral membrane protein [Streptomyces lividans 1326]|uniref:Integral membrane protein n=1 Tax=Streptomyces lividans 1326 TaxID=1200984 RepID=A0A7U9DJS0_STRLI|nr:Integral membrane protein [Streptomyces lividans 1326]
MLLKTFRWAFAVTALGLAAGVLYDGWTALGIVAILSVLEISLSFDNAVINAGILKKMNAFWQRIFLTVGIVIAVFGMRLVFPVVIVAVSARLSPWSAVHLALTDKDRYQELVTDAHPSIAAFGGMFLMMIFLDFVFEERDIKWLGWLERPLAKLGRGDMLSVCIALVVLLVSATTFGAHAHQHGGTHADKAETVLLAGVAGLITYMVVGGLSGFFEQRLEDEEEREQGGGEEGGEGRGTGGAARFPRQAGGQGGVLHVPLPGGPGRLLLLRRRHRRLRHHQRHRPDGPRPGHRRHVRPVAHGLPGPPGHPRRLRLPGARRPLRHRRPVADPPRHHPVRDQRDRHRPRRRRAHRRLLLVLRAPQPRAAQRLMTGGPDRPTRPRAVTAGA